MKIRKAKKSDLSEIATIMFEEFSKPPYNEKESMSNVKKSLNFYFKVGEIYVAILGKKVVGILIFKKEIYWEGPVFIIEDLAVKEGFKGKGVGKNLMEFLDSEAKRKRISSIYLITHKDARAIKFYNSLDYSIGNKTISMRKKLK